LFRLVANTVTGLLVPFSLVFLLQTIRVFNSHIEWVVHETIELNGDGQFLHFVLSVHERLRVPLIYEVFLLALIAELSLQYVIVIAGPVLVGAVGFLHTHVGLLLLVVVLQVPVGDNVVLADAKLLDILASDPLYDLTKLVQRLHYS